MVQQQLQLSLSGSVLVSTMRSIASALLSYGALIAYYDRPRGTLHPNIDQYVTIQPSQIILPKQPTTNKEELTTATTALMILGVYCRNHTTIPKGTILGTYPGVLIPLPSTYTKNNNHYNCYTKLRQYPQCEKYIWRFSDNQYIIDPTNPDGTLSSSGTSNGRSSRPPNDDTNHPNQQQQYDHFCYGGNPNTFGSIWFHQTIIPYIRQSIDALLLDNNNKYKYKCSDWFQKSTLLCRINEPPKGYDVNVITVEHLHNRSVSFITERTIYANEELFIDYGLYYDRSDYQ
jgi:hypothetical protein